MSGLEILGAVASAAGILGVLKTCVDLFDIVSSVKTTERSLEDLFVQLQWQRVRFHCWIHETGFVAAILEEETSERTRAPAILSFLPAELRLPILLAQINRSITNMSQHLRAAEPILHRYAAKPRNTEMARTWRQKLSLLLDFPAKQDGDRPKLVVGAPNGATGFADSEPWKLGIWSKLRWASGDMKELTYLVETLQKYNAELEGLLSSSRMARLERRLGRVIVTSPLLLRELGSGDWGDQVQLNAEDQQSVRRYQDLARLVESRRREPLDVETVDDAANTPVTVPDDADGQSHGMLQVIQSAKPKPRLRSPSPYLRKSEFRLAPFDTKALMFREFASHGNNPIVIEWRYYSTKTRPATLSYLDARVHMLAIQLQQLYCLDEKGVLSCLGHFHDKENFRHGVVFQYPRGTHTTTPITLHDRLENDHKRRARRDLNARFALARTLVLTLYRLFSVRWLHKNISSDTVLLFDEPDADAYSLPDAYVCGFAFARRDARFERSEKIPSVFLGKDIPVAIEHLYWHPARIAMLKYKISRSDAEQAAEDADFSTVSYRREFDTYSLGILLLEIGLWCPVRRIFSDCKTDNLEAFAADVKERYVPELRGRMGKPYADAVAACIAGEFGQNCRTEGMEAGEDDEMQMRDFLESFEKRVVDSLDGSAGT